MGCLLYKDKLQQEIRDNLGLFKVKRDIRLDDKVIEKGTHIWRYFVTRCNEDRTDCTLALYVYDSSYDEFSECRRPKPIIVDFTDDSGFDPDYWFESAPEFDKVMTEMGTFCTRQASTIRCSLIGVLCYILFFAVLSLGSLVENRIDPSIIAMAVSVPLVAIFGLLLPWLRYNDHLYTTTAKLKGIVQGGASYEEE